MLCGKHLQAADSSGQICWCQDLSTDSGCKADVSLEGHEREGKAQDCSVCFASGKQQSAKAGRTRAEGLVKMDKRNPTSNVAALPCFSPWLLPALSSQASALGKKPAEMSWCRQCEVISWGKQKVWGKGCLPRGTA